MVIINDIYIKYKNLEEFYNKPFEEINYKV